MATGLGLVIGVIGALALTPLLRTVLYRVEPHDPYLMATALTTLLLVSTAAWVIPRAEPRTSIQLWSCGFNNRWSASNGV